METIFFSSKNPIIYDLLFRFLENSDPILQVLTNNANNALSIKGMQLFSEETFYYITYYITDLFFCIFYNINKILVLLNTFF